MDRREEKAMVMAGRRLARLRLFAAVIALTAPAALAGGPAPVLATHVNEVVNWNKIAVETLTAFPGPAGGAPPAAQIHMAMTQGAVYDAVNAIVGAHEPYLLDARFASSASKDAAIATAAYLVLNAIADRVPGSIAFGNKATLQARWATEYAASLAHIVDSGDKTEGIAAGTAAAAAMIAARAHDGRFGPSQWIPNTAPGDWWPQLDANGAPILDPTPWAGGVDPFLMTSSSQFRTDGPQELTSDAWAEDFNEVKSLGSVDSATRTADQTHIARFWQSTPVATWNAVARALAVDAFNVGVAESARFFAMLNLTGADASINCWNDKYYWDFWRPWNAIPRAAEDGNPDTEPDASWRPLIAAPYPDHPSGHLCLDSAYLNVMRKYFATDKARYAVTSVQFPGEIRYFDRFSDAIKEIIDARIWAGLHYRTADVASVVLGRKVAHYMFRNYFKPLD